MSSNSKDIKRKISSINSTKQITKAMQMVATAKLKNTRKRLDTAKAYFETIYDSVVDLLSLDHSITHPYLEVFTEGQELIIVITGDRGLAGGYNINAMKKAEELVQDKNGDALVTVGKKAIDYFNFREYNVLKSFVDISENPTLSDSYEIAEFVIDKYLHEDYKKISIVYTRFVSTIRQEVTSRQILPFEYEKNEATTVIRYEPSDEEVLTHLIPVYVQNTIYGALMESSASEQAARRVAMENATDNAKEMIEDLELEFNQARQAAITQEISEIVGGAGAL